MRRLRNCILRVYQETSGQAIILFAIVLPVLVAFAAMAIDLGILHYQKEQLQSAAQAAAMAGAMQISACSGFADCSAMTTAALDALTENGYTNIALNTQCGSTSGNNLILTLNNGPCALGSTANDPNYGNANYVEAVVSKDEPTYFARLIGINHVMVVARAEATLGNSPFCLYFSTGDTSASASEAVRINGAASITASCGLIDDSGSSTALLMNGGTLTTTVTDIHGGALINAGTISPSPSLNAPALPDPLSYLQPPVSGSCTSIPNQATTIFPGTYCNGITINGSENVTFSPGVYYMEGNLIVNGNDTVSGNGVTFYFSSGSLTMNGGSHVNFVAPTTGTYAGILYYQNPSDTSTIILNGDSTSIYQGVVYAPGANLTINGGGNVAAYTILDTQSIIDNGNGSFGLGDNYSSLPGGDPIKGPAPVLSE